MTFEIILTEFWNFAEQPSSSSISTTTSSVTSMTSLEHESNDTSVSASDYGADNWDQENWGDMDVSLAGRSHWLFQIFSKILIFIQWNSVKFNKKKIIILIFQKKLKSWFFKRKIRLSTIIYFFEVFKKKSQHFLTFFWKF